MMTIELALAMALLSYVGAGFVVGVVDLVSLVRDRISRQRR